MGRSVLCRNVRQGTPSAVVSSWTPPESVSNLGCVDELQKVQVALGSRELHAWCYVEPFPSRLLQAGTRPWVDRKEDRQFVRDVAQDVEENAEAGRVVDVGRAVQGHEREAPGLESSPSSCRALRDRARSMFKSSESIMTLPT